jgi:hypothetical protein
MLGRDELDQFFRRWDIELPEAQTFLEFRTRVLRAVNQFRNSLSQRNILDLLEDSFSVVNGSSYIPDSNHYNRIPSNFKTFCAKATDINQLVLILQRCFWSIEKMACGKEIETYEDWHSKRYGQSIREFLRRVTEVFVSEMNQVLEFSHGVNFKFVQDQYKVEVVPAGVPILDTKVVCGSIEWLKKYPDVAAQFKTALQIAARNQEGFYRQAMDFLRSSIDKLLRVILKNDACLDKQIANLRAWLEERGVHAGVRETYTSVLSDFAAYQKEALKVPASADENQRRLSKPELEYMIYLTGTMMRFLLEQAGD